jgi:hypothetical protein
MPLIYISFPYAPPFQTVSYTKLAINHEISDKPFNTSLASSLVEATGFPRPLHPHNLAEPPDLLLDEHLVEQKTGAQSLV